MSGSSSTLAFQKQIKETTTFTLETFPIFSETVSENTLRLCAVEFFFFLPQYRKSTNAILCKKQKNKKHVNAPRARAGSHTHVCSSPTDKKKQKTNCVAMYQVTSRSKPQSNWHAAAIRMIERLLFHSGLRLCSGDSFRRSDVALVRGAQSRIMTGNGRRGGAGWVGEHALREIGPFKAKFSSPLRHSSVIPSVNLAGTSKDQSFAPYFFKMCATSAHGDVTKGKVLVSGVFRPVFYPVGDTERHF